jgi:hypothetical protein
MPELEEKDKQYRIEDIGRFLKINLLASILPLIIMFAVNARSGGNHPGILIALLLILIINLPFLPFFQRRPNIKIANLYPVYAVVVAHWLLVSLFLLLGLISLLSFGFLFIFIFVLSGFMLVPIYNYGFSFLYLLLALIWLLWIPRRLLPLFSGRIDKRQNLNLFAPFMKFSLSNKLFYSVSILFYCFLFLMFYTFMQFFLIPVKSGFWNSWIFN